MVESFSYAFLRSAESLPDVHSASFARYASRLGLPTESATTYASVSRVFAFAGKVVNSFNVGVSTPLLKNIRLLLDVENSRSTTTITDVVHAGTASKSHIRIANKKTARVLFWMMVIPSIQFSTGKHHTISAAKIAITRRIVRDAVFESVL